MFKQFCATKGILHRCSCIHLNKTILSNENTIKSLAWVALFFSQPKSPSIYGLFCTIVYFTNRFPTHVLQWASPFFKLYGKHPDYSFLRTCPCFLFLGDYVTNKLQPRSLTCIFVGYRFTVITTLDTDVFTFPPVGSIHLDM